MKLGGETRGVRLKLPATSANLGPGFDAVGLALSMHLTVEAHPSPTWQIHATGRDAAAVGSVENNLMLDAYRSEFEGTGHTAPALRLRIHNEIPLGMGCGSSAAALCAGVALAAHFGQTGYGSAGIVAEAAEREGHPDNVAACWYGGFTVSTLDSMRGLQTATFPPQPGWDLLLVIQNSSLATRTARALLPEQYSRADAVFNVQRTALLTAAFASGRLDLLRAATDDRMHQPYRAGACPLLPLLLPLREEPEIAAVTLSGAGPSVLLFLAENVTPWQAEARLAALLPEGVEVLPVRISEGATTEVLDAP